MKTWSGSVFGVPLFSLLRCIFNFKIAAFATGGGARVLSVCIAGVAIQSCFVLSISGPFSVFVCNYLVVASKSTAPFTNWFISNIFTL